MPSPTRATTVSSVAPPINCCRFVRTVTRADLQLDAVLGDGAEHCAIVLARIGTIDDFGVDACLHGRQNIAPSEIDGCGPIEFQIDIRTMRGDDRLDDAGDIAPGQIMRLQLARGYAR